MYVTVVPNRDSPPAVLLRESYREGGKVKNRTLANLSKWPAVKVAALRAILADKALVPAAEGLSIERSLPHGHVAAALGVARKIGLDRVLPKGPRRKRDLVLAMIVARLASPAAKLATARALDEATATSSLGRLLGLGAVAPNELYEALDWLLAGQAKIEKALAGRHLRAGTLVLYDLTSTYLEGRCCPLARRGYSRDHRRDRPQIVFGLLCSADGCPVAVEVFAGNVGDPTTLKTQVDKLRRRFGLERIVLVGDRGMITQARLDTDVRPAGLDWITALRAPAIQALAEAGGPLQPELFDERDLAEIESPDFPGERLIVCRNQALAIERTRKRQDLLATTERELARIQVRVRRARTPLRGKAKIALAVGAVIGRRKMAKHFKIAIADEDFAFERDLASIDAEARLDGIYVVRTSLARPALDAAGVVAAYKSLARVEHAFRSLKSVDLKVRPVFHWTEDRVRAHVLLCMLAYHLEWHMRAPLAPILFDDHDRAAAEALRTSPVAKAQVSPAARRKAAAKITEDGLPVSSFRSLLAHLATLTCNDVRFGAGDTLTHLTSLTPVQQRAFDLLGLKPAAGL
ncbi:MAG TPA: IS1634 family transposase [Caulobacteraceae bacterium]